MPMACYTTENNSYTPSTILLYYMYYKSHLQQPRKKYSKRSFSRNNYSHYIPNSFFQGKIFFGVILFFGGTIQSSMYEIKNIFFQYFFKLLFKEKLFGIMPLEGKVIRSSFCLPSEKLFGVKFFRKKIYSEQFLSQGRYSEKFLSQESWFERSVRENFFAGKNYSD